jgi:DNA-binding CsgD family transcriptional regulator
MPLARVRYEGEELSPREKQVLRRIALGDTVPEVADHLGIGYETARRHTKGARAKLGARTTAQAVAIAVSLDLV